MWITRWKTDYRESKTNKNYVGERYEAIFCSVVWNQRNTVKVVCKLRYLGGVNETNQDRNIYILQAVDASR